MKISPCMLLRMSFLVGIVIMIEVECPRDSYHKMLLLGEANKEEDKRG